MSRVFLRRIDPGTLHGFRAGSLLLDDLAPGLNVFYAPNASGKSTLARAIGLLLSPERCDPDTTISGTVEGPRGVEERAVRKKDPAYDGFPGRPESYLLDLVSLLDGFRDKQEQAVLGRLVSSDVFLSPGSPTFRKPASVNAATLKLDELRRVRRTADEASGAEDALTALRAEAAEATDAERAVRRLESLVERRRIGAARSAAERAIADGDEARPGLERGTVGAMDAANLLRRALRQADESLEAVRRERGEGSPSRPLDPSDRANLEGLGREVQDGETTIRALEGDRERAAVRLRDAADVLLRLLPGEDPATLPHPTAADVAALRGAAGEAEKRAARRLELEAYELAHTAWREAHPDDGADLAARIEACRAWLAEETIVAPDRRPPVLLAVAGIGASASAFLGPFAALVVLVVAAAAFLALRPQGTTSGREGLAARHPGLPKDATGVAVELRDLLLRTARREVGVDLGSRARGKAPEGGWEGVADSLRLKVTDPLLLLPVVQSILSYEAARTVLHETDAALDGERARRETARAALRSVFRRYGFPDEGERPETALAPFTRWFALSEEFEKKARERDEAAQSLTAHLDLQGVPAGEIDARLAEIAEREPLVAERRRLLDEVAHHARSLAALPPPDSRDEGLSDEDLLQRIEAARAEAARYGDLERAIGSAETTIANAVAARRLEAAEDGYARAYGAVETKFGEMVREAVRARLHTALAERLRREDVPPIVRAANAHLERFSRGRYRLELAASEAEGLGTLVVYDAERGKEQRFNALSTGTKVHAVFALRLGLIDEHERQGNGGTLRFPLVADEAMAVSDPEASAAIAQALVDVAETRQVIVFTNAPEDLTILGSLVEGFEARTLGSAAPASRAADPPRYRPPRGPGEFDPGLPIRAHAVAAVLPLASEAETVGEWLPSAGAEWVAFVEGMERMRLDLVLEYPRLDWAAISYAAWVTPTFRLDIHRIALACGGSAPAFLDALNALKNFRKKDEAREWLEENGFLKPCPDEETIRRVALRCLPEGTDPFRVGHAVRLFTAAFA